MTDARGNARPNGDGSARNTPGTPCWVSLMARGLDATEQFYGALFGWEFRPGPRPLGPYVRAVLDGHPVAGIGVLPADRRLPVAWTPYFASDPSGAVFGIWQAADGAAAGVTGRPGTPAWNELTTFETTNVAKFYETVFGYDEDAVVSADLDYVTLRLDGRPVTGVHGLGNALPRDRGPYWTTYFTVADTDDAVDQVLHLGGQVLAGPRDTEHGRVAMVADPEGARFALVRRRTG
jgi:predicted enzyme related to lactoylglutathione lyase